MLYTLFTLSSGGGVHLGDKSLNLACVHISGKESVSYDTVIKVKMH